MVNIIGLEKIIEVYGTNANQLATKLGVKRFTIYDWLKVRRKIPQKRLDQLSKLNEFKYIKKEIFQKEIDEKDLVAIYEAHSKYLSENNENRLKSKGNIEFSYRPINYSKENLTLGNIEINNDLNRSYEDIEKLESDLLELQKQLIINKVNTIFEIRDTEKIKQLLLYFDIENKSSVITGG